MTPLRAPVSLYPARIEFSYLTGRLRSRLLLPLLCLLSASHAFSAPAAAAVEGVCEGGECSTLGGGSDNTAAEEWQKEKAEWLEQLHRDKEAWIDAQEQENAVWRRQVLEEMAAARNKGNSDDDSASAESSRLAAQLQSELRTLQFPSDCDRVQKLHFYFRQMGLGSEWHGITLALTYTYETRRTTLLDPQPTAWIWGDPANCPHDSMACYFEPITNCRAPPVAADATAAGSPAEFKWGMPYQPEPLTFMQYEVWNRGNRHVPAAYAAQGLLWWRSQLLRFLLRPKPVVAAEIAAARRAIGFDRSHPIIGIHVRRGAKWMEAKPVEFENYMTKARELRAQNSALQTIYLATDDDGIVERIRSGEIEKLYSEFKFIYNDNWRWPGNKNVTMMDEIRRRWAAPREEAMQYIKDIFLMAEVDYFIGTWSSNFGRVVLEMMFAAKGSMPLNCFSMDREWTVDP